MSAQKRIGFIGFGNMGQGIAANFLKGDTGYPLRVYHRNKEKARSLVGQGAILEHEPSDVIDSGGTVFTMLADDFAAWLNKSSFGFTAKRLQNLAQVCVGLTAKRLENSAQGGGFAEPWV
jgi:pyrroline-5-carboxylate reductase